MELVSVVVLLSASVIAAVVRFEMFCLRDLADTPDWQLRGLDRRGWTLVTLLSIPLGGIAYLYYGKTR